MSDLIDRQPVDKDINVPCTDTISRQAAIDAVCEHGTDLERRGITVLSVANHKQATVDLLESLPSVQERKKGRWVRKKDKKINAWWHSCSECGARPLKTLFGQYDALSVYCPNCGARMEGAEDAGRNE